MQAKAKHDAKFQKGCVVDVQKTFTSEANKTPTELTKGTKGELLEIDGDGDYKIKWNDGTTTFVFKGESLNIDLVRTAAEVCIYSTRTRARARTHTHMYCLCTEREREREYQL